MAVKVDWEKINKIREESSSNRTRYLIEVIKELEADRAQLEREMREIIAVSPSLVNYAREITSELKKAIETFLPLEAQAKQLN
jgi:orotate phosphoribosyltransferase-like protein